MENNNKIAYIVRIVRDIVITILVVLLIVSMVHYDKYGAGFYLGLPISNDKNAKEDVKKAFQVGVKKGYNDSIDINIKGISDYIDVRHKNSCVNGYSFDR